MVQVPLSKYSKLKAEAILQRTTVPRMLEARLREGGAPDHEFCSPQRSASESSYWRTSEGRQSTDMDYGSRLRQMMRRRGTSSMTMREACQALSRRVEDIVRYCEAAKLYIVDRGEGHHRKWIQLTPEVSTPASAPTTAPATRNGHAAPRAPGRLTPEERARQNAEFDRVAAELKATSTPSPLWEECQREAGLEIAAEIMTKKTGPSALRCEICGNKGAMLDKGRNLCEECRADAQVTGRSP